MTLGAETMSESESCEDFDGQGNYGNLYFFVIAKQFDRYYIVVYNTDTLIYS